MKEESQNSSRKDKEEMVERVVVHIIRRRVSRSTEIDDRASKQKRERLHCLVQPVPTTIIRQIPTKKKQKKTRNQKERKKQRDKKEKIEGEEE